MPLLGTEDTSISLLNRATAPGRPRASAPRKGMCIRGRTRQPPDSSTAIVTIDLRTTIGKRAKQFRDDLVRHCGGKPNGVQVALIERAIQLKLRVVAMDMDFEASGSMSTHASKSYLAWSNSLTRVLATILGMKAAPQSETLADILADIGTHKRAQTAPTRPAAPPASALPGTAPKATTARDTPRIVADTCQPGNLALDAAFNLALGDALSLDDLADAIAKDDDEDAAPAL